MNDFLKFLIIKLANAGILQCSQVPHSHLGIVLRGGHCIIQIDIKTKLGAGAGGKGSLFIKSSRATASMIKSVASLLVSSKVLGPLKKSLEP